MNSTIRFTDDAQSVDWTTVQRLFAAVDWPRRTVADIERAFGSSTYKLFAYHDDRLVGFARTTDDGINYALICDLVIDPAYQGQGVGSELLETLRLLCADFQFITLTAAEGKDGFYLRQGWKRQTTSFIWPRNEKQASIHAE